MSTTGTYNARQFNLSGLKGISDQTLEMHFKLYEGYVKETNNLTTRIGEFIQDAKVDQEEMPAYSELTRRLGFEYNGMVLHEYYFDNLKKGVDVLIDIDTQGAAAIRNCGDPFVQDALADVFIMPPNLEELRRRLTKRRTETAQQIEARLKTAAREMKHWRDYRYTIISKSMEEDLLKFRQIMGAERILSRRLILQ